MLTVSERRACRVLGQVKRTQRYTPRVADEEAVLTAEIVSLASAYGRYGYRRITALLSAEGWRVNHKRVERIWRQEGLKAPGKQPKRGRLWLTSMVPVSGYGLSIATTSGPMISCSTERARGGL